MQTAASYVWSFTGAPLRIALDLPVVSAIRDAMDRQTGMEIGGLLLGSSSGGVTHITGFEAVNCEHRRGPAYDLSPEDRGRFSRVYTSLLKKRGRDTTVVGYFRTHQRLGLYLDEHDFRTVQEFFPNADQVVLLIRPERQAEPVAGFFFWEDGEMHRRESFQTFPFDEHALASGGFPLEGAVQPEPAPAAAPRFAPVTNTLRAEPRVAPTPEPKAPAARPARLPDRAIGGGRWWKAAAVLAGIPLGAAIAHWAGLGQRNDGPIVNTAPAARLAQAPDAVRAPAPSTNATPQEPTQVANAAPGEAIEVSPYAKPSPWSGSDSSAPATRQSAPPGRAYINGDAATDSTPAATLRNGPARSTDGAPDQRFATNRPPVPRQDPLESPLPYSRPAARPLQPAQFARPAHEPAPVTAQNSPATSNSTVVPSSSEKPATIQLSPAPQNRQPETRQITAENVPPAVDRQPEPVEAPVRPRHVFRPESRPAISLEPLDDQEPVVTKNVRRFGRLMTLGVLGQNQFVPPRPVHEFAPAVPESVARQLTEVVPISVRISVDRRGRVRGTELLTRAADPELALLAVDAARKWEFEAARRNDEPVSSSVVAHFRFRPPQ